MPDPHLPDIRAIYNASQHFIGMLSTEGVLLDANQTALDSVGLRLEEVQGLPFWETPWWTHDPLQQARLRAGIGQAAQGEPFLMETTHRDASGRLLVVGFSIRPLRNAEGEVVALVPEGHDISPLAQERERLRLSELRFRTLVEHAPEAIVLLDAALGRFIEVNPLAEALFKADRARLLDLGPIALSPPFQPDGRPSSEAAAQHIQQALRDGTATFDWTHQTLAGEPVPCEVRLLRLPGSRGDLVRGSLVDLRPRIAKETHLRESERKFRLLFERSVEGLLLLDGDRFTDCNQAVLDLLRCTEPEFLKLHPWELSPPTQPDGRASEEKAREMMALAYARGVHRFEWMHRRLDGEDVPVEVTLIPIPLEGREVLFTSWRDLTEVKRAEQERLTLQRQMLHAQKLESLGVLAGGIAHDFNNLLTAILGNLNLAQDRLPGDTPVRGLLQATERAALKASELTRQLLAYSGKGKFVVKPHDLNQLVRDMTNLLQVSIPKKVELQFDLEANLPAVEADEAQVQQVLLNLITNAADAIGDLSGTIRIATRSRDLDPTYLGEVLVGQGLVPGRYAALEVTDSGCGMSPEVQARIFDPFFTTKPTGHGLGLSALQGILQGHHAGLRVYSEAGRGTAFHLFFPAVGGAPASGETPPPGRQVAFSGQALLVDDEAEVRAVATKALEHFGFTVTAAADGQEGLELFSRDPGAYRVALLDLTMPRMDGRECFRALRRLRPDLPVILCSGFSEQETVQSLVGERLTGFVQKPYTLAALRQAFETALGGGSI